MDIRTIKLSELNPAKYNPRKELKPGEYVSVKITGAEEYDLQGVCE